jgi:hypothetical protein
MSAFLTASQGMCGSSFALASMGMAGMTTTAEPSPLSLGDSPAFLMMSQGLPGRAMAVASLGFPMIADPLYHEIEKSVPSGYATLLSGENTALTSYAVQRRVDVGLPSSYAAQQGLDRSRPTSYGSLCAVDNAWGSGYSVCLGVLETLLSSYGVAQQALATRPTSYAVRTVLEEQALPTSYNTLLSNQLESQGPSSYGVIRVNAVVGLPSSYAVSRSVDQSRLSSYSSSLITAVLQTGPSSYAVQLQTTKTAPTSYATILVLPGSLKPSGYGIIESLDPQTLLSSYSTALSTHLEQAVLSSYAVSRRTVSTQPTSYITLGSLLKTLQTSYATRLSEAVPGDFSLILLLHGYTQDMF